MFRGFIGLLKATAGLAFVVIVFGNYVIIAQSGISGEWKSRTSEKNPDQINISFDRSTEKGRNNFTGMTFKIGEEPGLAGLTTQNGPVRFSLVREAGSVEGEGTITNGKGTGTYRFVPSAQYRSAMQSRGFEFDDEKQFGAAILDVKVGLADELLSANFGQLKTEDLFKAKIFNIDANFMREMAATGFPNLGMQELVKARIFKIDAEFVRSIKDMGFGVENFENLVKYSIFKVTPEYLNSLRTEGLIDLSPEQIVKLRIFKIDAAFVREARTADPNVTVEQLVQKKIGVRWE
jgi:hypothetical protein